MSRDRYGSLIRVWHPLGVPPDAGGRRFSKMVIAIRGGEIWNNNFFLTAPAELTCLQWRRVNLKSDDVGVSLWYGCCAFWNLKQKDPKHEGGLGWCEGFVLSGSMCFEKIIIFLFVILIMSECDQKELIWNHMTPDGSHEMFYCLEWSWNQMQSAVVEGELWWSRLLSADVADEYKLVFIKNNYFLDMLAW